MGCRRLRPADELESIANLCMTERASHRVSGSF